MRRIVFGLLLVPLIACSDVVADDAQVPNAYVPNANTGGSQQGAGEQKTPLGAGVAAQPDRPRQKSQADI
jgi:hypothetical protein